MAGDYDSRTAGQRAWLAGAVAIVGLLTIAGGWLVWRGLRTPDLPAASPAAGGQAATVPSDGPLGLDAQVMVDGVPWGFPLTVDGAAAAAAVAVSVTGQPQVVFDADRFDQVAEVVFTDEQADVQARQVDAVRAELELSAWADQPASRRMYYFAPLAVKVIDFDADRPAATVQVWSMTLVGVGDAGGAVFTTSTVELAGDVDGGWAVSGLESVEGPTPLVASVASPPGATRALLRGSHAVVPLPLEVVR